jgi:molecular chaperone GrpE
MSENQENPSEKEETASAPGQEVSGDGTGKTPAPDIAPPTPEERIANLEGEKAELRDRMLRIAADFDNWKKRSRKEQSDGESRVKEGVLRDFLEIVDNLERATASWGEGKESDAKSVKDGVELVLRQFRNKLERYQVKSIESAGQAFDPRMHEAISQVPTSDVKPGSVVHELQKGYVIGDKLLRPAMVVVATAAQPAAKPDGAATNGGAPAKTEGED